MFSATFPKSARRLAKEYMDDECVRIKVGRVGSTHQNITQQVIFAEESAKSQALFDLIFSEVSPKPDVRTSSETNNDFVHQHAGPSAYPGIHQLQSQV
jgi:ATP-dependent RNA helicase DDX3X